MENKTDFLVYTTARHAEIQSHPLPPLGENDIFINTLFSGISRGTERLVFNGAVPKSQWETMACKNQLGHFSFPIGYGYQHVGEIVASGSNVTNLKKGDLVFSLTPHQRHAVISADMAHKIPESIPAKRAVLCANMETALNAFWDSEATHTHKVAVIGGGVVGFLTAYCTSHFLNTPVTLIDVDKNKKVLAEMFGVSFKTPKEIDEKYDILFHTSATQEGLQSAINHAAFEGKIIEMSWFGDQNLCLNLGGTFHSQRLQIHSSQVGHISPKKRSHYSYRDRMAEVLKLLQDTRLDHLLEAPIPFKNLPEHLNTLFNHKTGTLCQIVTYQENSSGEN